MKEIELKLTLPTADAAGLKAQLSAIPLLANSDASEVRTFTLNNIYFDTPDHRLHSKRIALRLRQKETLAKSQWLQTLKIGASTDSALSQRGEWEFAVSDATLSLGLLQQTPWAQLDPDGALFATLTPCFSTVFERSVWQVHCQDGSRIELALDRGQVLAAGKTCPICELELELLTGQTQALFDLADLLAKSIALLPATASKAQRGFALAQNQINTSSVHRQKRENLTPALAHPIMRKAFGSLINSLNAVLMDESSSLPQQVQKDLRHFRAAVKYFNPLLKQPVPQIVAIDRLAKNCIAREHIMQFLLNPQTGAELLKISRYLDLDS